MRKYIQRQLEPRRIPHPWADGLEGYWLFSAGVLDEKRTNAARQVIKQAQFENKLARIADSN